MFDTSIVQGSIGAMAQRDGISIAESFLSADYIVLVDVSGSMNSHDSRGGRTRYTVACEELANLQAQYPGKVAVVAFSSKTEFVPGGIPPFFGMGTDLTSALQFVQPADGCATFIVISDGEPDDERSALRIASSFTSRIDCIHVGPETDHRGRDFLQRLSKASGGSYVTADRGMELAKSAEMLMLGKGTMP